jgi:periplasmic divalent cation tolerance protein
VHSGGPPEIGVVITTVADAEQARALGERLVRDRAAACATTLPHARSVYRWKGATESTEEVILVLKTRAGCVDRLADALRTLHPYDVPEILVFANVRASAEYTAWVEDEVPPCSDPSSR